MSMCEHRPGVPVIYCEQCLAKAKETHQIELAKLTQVPNLPREIQNHVWGYCDLTSLSALSKLNKEWHASMTPRLWRHLDFVRAFKDSGNVVESTRLFFALCDRMLDEVPERFAVFAGYVQTLDVGRLHGINIVRDAEVDPNDDYIYYNGLEEGQRCVFDVIAHFSNLELLSVYMKNWSGWEDKLTASAEAIARGLKKLRSLKLGGQMSGEVLCALLNQPELLRYLTLINLIDEPSQDSGPDGVWFLPADLCARLTGLETLHLCKLADLEPRLTYSDDEAEADDADDRSESSEASSHGKQVSGLRWRFPRGSEVNVLMEWAEILQQVSGTLRELTLENRYLVHGGFDTGDSGRIDPGKTHPDDYGVFSITESQRILFPELSGREWPQLQKLTLVGMGAVERVNVAVAHLQPRVLVKQELATVECFVDDATPLQVGTPAEFY